MLKIAQDVDLIRKLDALDARAPGAAADAEVTKIVEAVLASLSGDMSAANLKFYCELEELARYIQSAKREIAEIQPHDIRSQHIPAATDELDAVVGATAEATGAILDAAEVIERRTGEMVGETASTVAGAVTNIYEACNFQDITGQRITKVVATLKHIEAKIDALLVAFDQGIADAPRPAAAPPANGGDRLMNGPQLPGSANNQADIDAILASFD